MTYQCGYCRQYNAHGQCNNDRCLGRIAYCPEPDCIDGTLEYDDGVPKCIECGQEAFLCTVKGIYMENAA